MSHCAYDLSCNYEVEVKEGETTDGRSHCHEEGAKEDGGTDAFEVEDVVGGEGGEGEEDAEGHGNEGDDEERLVVGVSEGKGDEGGDDPTGPAEKAGQDEDSSDEEAVGVLSVLRLVGVFVLLGLGGHRYHCLLNICTGIIA